MKVFKIGLDIHGVIDSDPTFFAMLTSILEGHPEIEVHIITGGFKTKELVRLKDFNIKFDKFFSIPEYHQSIGTPITYDKNGNIWMDDLAWNKTKGEYCEKEGITIMIDDTLKYGKYMPKNTHFYYYRKNNS